MTMIHTEYDNYWLYQNVRCDPSEKYSESNKINNTLGSRSGYYSYQNRTQNIVQGNQYLNHENNLAVPQNNINLQGKSNISRQHVVPTSQEVWSAVQQGPLTYRPSFANNVNNETVPVSSRPVEYSFCNSQNFYNNYNMSNSQNSVIPTTHNLNENNNYMVPNYARDFQNNICSAVKPGKIRVKDVFSINNGISNQVTNNNLYIPQEPPPVNYPVDYISYLKRNGYPSQKHKHTDFSDKNYKCNRSQPFENSVNHIGQPVLTNSFQQLEASNNCIDSCKEQCSLINNRNQDLKTTGENFSSVMASNNVMTGDYCSLNESLVNNSANGKRVKINPRRNISRTDNFGSTENSLRDNIQGANVMSNTNHCAPSSFVLPHVSNNEINITTGTLANNIQGNKAKELHDSSMNNVDCQINPNFQGNYQSNITTFKKFNNINNSSQYQSNNYRSNMHPSVGKSIENCMSTKINDQSKVLNLSDSSETLKNLKNSGTTDSFHDTTSSCISSLKNFNLKFCNNNEVRGGIEPGTKHVNSDDLTLSSCETEKRNYNLKDQETPKNSAGINSNNPVASFNKIPSESNGDVESNQINNSGMENENEIILNTQNTNTTINQASVVGLCNREPNECSHHQNIETEKGKTDYFPDMDNQETVLHSKKPGSKSRLKTLLEGKNHTQTHESCENDNQPTLEINCPEEIEIKYERFDPVEEDNMNMEEGKQELYELEQIYKNKIDRKKLNLLIEFLKSDVYSINDSQAGENLSEGKKTNNNKRKYEDDTTIENRRKLTKQRETNSKNNEENISCVSQTTNNITLKALLEEQTPCGKSCTIDNNSYATNVSEENEKMQNNETDNYSKLVVKKEVDSESNVKNDNEEDLSGNKLEEKEKHIFPSKFQNLDNEALKESTEPINTIRESINVMPKTSAKEPSSSHKVFEENGIINTMKVLQKLPYHKCVSCNIISSNNSFWINVVSGELRCLNCFQIMINRSESKSKKNVDIKNASSKKNKSHKKHASKIENVEKKSVKTKKVESDRKKENKQNYDERRKENKQNYDERKREDKQNYDERKKEDKQNYDERKKEDKQNYDERKKEDKQNYNERKKEEKQNYDERKKEEKQNYDERKKENKQNYDEKRKEDKRVEHDHRTSFVKTIFEQKNHNIQDLSRKKIPHKEKKEKHKADEKDKEHALKKDIEIHNKEIEKSVKIKDKHSSKDYKKSDKTSKLLHSQENYHKNISFYGSNSKEIPKKGEFEKDNRNTEEKPNNKNCKFISESNSTNKDGKKDHEIKEKYKQKSNSVKHDAKVYDSQEFSTHETENVETTKVGSELQFLNKNEKRPEILTNSFEGYFKNKIKNKERFGYTPKLPLNIHNSKETDKKEEDKKVVNSGTVKNKDECGTKKIETHSLNLAQLHKKTKDLSHLLLSEN